MAVRDEIIKASMVGGVAAVFTYFVLTSIINIESIVGDIAGLDIGQYIGLFMAAIVGAAVFGDLLSDALKAD